MGFGICNNSINDEYPEGIPRDPQNIHLQRCNKSPTNENSQISSNYRTASVHNLFPFIKLKKIIPEEIKLAKVNVIHLTQISVIIEYPLAQKKPVRKRQVCGEQEIGGDNHIKELQSEEIISQQQVLNLFFYAFLSDLKSQ